MCYRYPNIPRATLAKTAAGISGGQRQGMFQGCCRGCQATRERRGKVRQGAEQHCAGGIRWTVCNHRRHGEGQRRRHAEQRQRERRWNYQSLNKGGIIGRLIQASSSPPLCPAAAEPPPGPLPPAPATGPASLPDLPRPRPSSVWPGPPPASLRRQGRPSPPAARLEPWGRNVCQRGFISSAQRRNPV